MPTPDNIRETRRPTRQVGINFGNFQERVNRVKVVYKVSKDDPATEVMVWYWPAKFNDETMRMATAARRTMADGSVSDIEGQDSIDIINNTIIEVVQQWDIFDGDPDDPKSTRLDPASIVDQLEINFKSEVVEAIYNDMKPGESKRQR